MNDNTLFGYEPPILLVAKSVGQQIANNIDDEIILAIKREIGVVIDQERLKRLLEFDSDQYKKGFKNGYEKAMNDTIGKIIDKAKTIMDDPCSNIETVLSIIDKALEKQTPKRLIVDKETNVKICPNCGATEQIADFLRNCNICGQKIILE